ncbi:MAG TPA: hypothetical protein PLU80_17575 [Acidobacteriota bacterium]|nr:hypothetical protein [Acidobacteriota bacterium]
MGRNLKISLIAKQNLQPRLYIVNAVAGLNVFGIKFYLSQAY